MDQFFDIFSILLGCYGAYFLYVWFCTAVLKRPLPDSKNILPADLTMKTCNDPEKCTARILPWLFITGLSLLAYAAASYFFGSEPWYLPAAFVYFGAVLAYYLVTMRTVRRLFWPDKVKKKEKK